MQQFLTRHQSVVKGVLSGLDRVRFRGTIRWLATLHGMGSFLGTIRVLMKEFRSWAMEITAQLKQGAEQVAEHAGRPVIYVASSRTNAIWTVWPPLNTPNHSGKRFAASVCRTR